MFVPPLTIPIMSAAMNENGSYASSNGDVYRQSSRQLTYQDARFGACLTASSYVLLQTPNYSHCNYQNHHQHRQHKPQMIFYNSSYLNQQMINNRSMLTYGSDKSSLSEHLHGLQQKISRSQKQQQQQQQQQQQEKQQKQQQRQRKSQLEFDKVFKNLNEKSLRNVQNATNSLTKFVKNEKLSNSNLSHSITNKKDEPDTIARMPNCQITAIPLLSFTHMYEKTYELRETVADQCLLVEAVLSIVAHKEKSML
uniref:Uncharacterized protein n=1 Tax=Glossina austeni TaxID=7395 RepID=A0A1A9UHH9_GLOAU